MKRAVSLALTVLMAVLMMPMLMGSTEANAAGAVLIDSFDDYGRLETIDKKQGAGAAVELITGGSGTEGVYCGVARAYEPAKDLSASITSDAYVHIWLYIRYTDCFMTAPKDAYLEFSSSGNGWTPGAVRYDLSGLNVVDGWNELFLPLSDFQSVDGVTPCDWSNVNFFRLYTHNCKADGGTFDQVIMVDGLSVGKAEDFPTMPQEPQTRIENFDLPTPYYAVSGVEAKEGLAAATVTAEGLTFVERVYTRTKDLSVYQNDPNAYIHAWLYVENAAYVSNTYGRLELSSGGFWGSQVVKYDVKKMQLHSGWNELYLPVKEFEVLDPEIGSCDWSRINYFRLYLQNTDQNGAAVRQTLKIDDLTVGVFPDIALPERETFDLSGSSMTLGNTLQINFAIDTTKLYGDGHYAVITKAYADGRDDVILTVGENEWTRFSADTKYVSFSVSAKEMTDKLTVTVYNAAGQQVTNVYEDSVADYCMRMLGREEEKPSPDEKKLALYVDMLNYGAAAQKYWEYHPETPANARLSELQKSYATKAVQGNNVLQYDSCYYGTSLSLKDKILLNIAYKAEEIRQAEYAVVSFTDHYGNDETVEIRAAEFKTWNAAVKYIEITALSVADCDQTVTVTMYDGSGRKLSTVVDSVESYVARKSGELYDAILAFGTGAYHYFHGEQTYEEGAYYTGRSVVSDLEDIRLGGPQYVAKLFTEGLSRAPTGDEYRQYTTVIEDRGCTVQTLSYLAEQFFTSEAFLEQDLTETGKVYTVYRAVLSREPGAAEVQIGKTMSAADIAVQLCAGAEFADLLSDINKGPYHWGGNNFNAFTGENIITGEELQELLNKNEVVSLPQGTQVLMGTTVVIPEGVTLQTEGNPDHYANMARLIRTGSSEHHLVILKDHAQMKNIYVEGSLSAVQTDQTLSGSNVLVSGTGGRVEHCRISDSVSHQNLWTIDGSSGGYLGYNLITGYASDHNATWQDGISCLGTGFLIEYNHVVDVTDASIAVFRYVDANSATPHARAQNSVVRYNRVMCMGNSAYAGYDHETGNYHTDKTDGPVHPANMTGLMTCDNEIWTSMRAHYHILFAMSTVPWMTESNCDTATGGSAYNNYTPEGCYALTGCAIALDQVSDAAVRGNRLHIYIGQWCRPTAGQGARIYSVNESNTANCILQAGYIDLPMTLDGLPFICTLAEGLLLERAERIYLEEAVVYEDRQTVPAERLLSETQ